MYHEPNQAGFYGDFGGQFVPETLMYAVKELTETYNASKKDEAFQKELQYYKTICRPENPLYFAENLTKKLVAPKLLKREVLNHTGATKLITIENLLARRWAK